MHSGCHPLGWRRLRERCELHEPGINVGVAGNERRPLTVFQCPRASALPELCPQGRILEQAHADRSEGINVPIIPGLKPLTTLKHIAFIPKTFHVDLPDDLAGELVKCTTDAAVKAIGVEWTLQQARELIAQKAPCLHFYTMGRSEAVRSIVSQLF